MSDIYHNDTGCGIMDTIWHSFMIYVLTNREVSYELKGFVSKETTNYNEYA